MAEESGLQGPGTGVPVVKPCLFLLSGGMSSHTPDNFDNFFYLWMIFCLFCFRFSVWFTATCLVVPPGVRTEAEDTDEHNDWLQQQIVHQGDRDQATPPHHYVSKKKKKSTRLASSATQKLSIKTWATRCFNVDWAAKVGFTQQRPLMISLCSFSFSVFFFYQTRAWPYLMQFFPEN